MAKVLVVLGSPSDVDKMRPCIETLKQFEVGYDVHCLSAHRNHEGLVDFINKVDNYLNATFYTPSEREEEDCLKAPNNDFGVIIAAAGMAAALPGVIASITPGLFYRLRDYRDELEEANAQADEEIAIAFNS